MFHGKAMRMAVVGALLMAMAGLSGCTELTKLIESVKTGLAGTQMDIDGLSSLLSEATASDSDATSETWEEDDQESWDESECPELS